MGVMANNIHIAIVTQQFKIAVSGIQPAIEHLFNTDFAEFKPDGAWSFLCAIPGITVHLNGNRFQGWVMAPLRLTPYSFAARSTRRPRKL